MERCFATGWITIGAVALVVYSIALNLIPFPAAIYVPANLTLAGLAVLAGRAAGLGWDELGFDRGQRRGWLLGLAIIAIVGAVMLIALQVPAAGSLLADQRAAGLAGWSLVYGAAIRIPLGTSVPEEVLFRGVLLAALRRRTTEWRAWLWASVVFGLWHIGPTIVLVRENALDTSAAVAGGVVALSVAVTFVAGIVFCVLRRWGGGLVAPVLAHTATNSLSLLAAVQAQAG